MTELEYIKVGDLKTLRIIKECTRDLMPEINDIIDKDELITVRTILDKWIDKSYKSIKIKQ